MNRIYKVIWSKVKHQYVVVSELAHSNGKQNSKSEHGVTQGALRGLAAALMVAGSLLVMPYTASAAEGDVYYQLQNGDEVVNIEENDLSSYFKIAKKQADGTYTINGQIVANEYLYDLGIDFNGDGKTEVGAFVVNDNIYTGDVYNQNHDVVIPEVQHTITNEDGFYASNGKGTYNSLTKDGLWVGGTKDGEGFHVDNDGNVRTTGNMMVDGKFSAGDNTIYVDENGMVDFGNVADSTGVLVNSTTGSITATGSIAANQVIGKELGGGNGAFKVTTDGKMTTTGEVLMKNDSGESFSITNGTDSGMNLMTVGDNGTGMITLNNGTVNLMGGSTTTVKVDGNGTTFGTLFGDKTTNINGDTVTTGKITGLSNTTWDGTTNDKSRAATEGQLSVVQGKLDVLNDEAVKYDKDDDGKVTNNVTIGGTLDAAKVTADEGTIGGVEFKNNGITLSDNIGSVKIEHGAITTTGNAQSTIGGVKFQNSDITANKATVSNSIQVGISQNPLETTRIDGGAISTGEIYAGGGDFHVDKTGAVTATEAQIGNVTLKDGKVTADKADIGDVWIKDGSITHVDKLAVERADIGGVWIKDDTITSLTNTKWDAENVVRNRAATEGQLLYVDTKVNQNTDKLDAYEAAGIVPGITDKNDTEKASNVIALGNGSQAIKDEAVAVGVKAIAKGHGAVSIGNNSMASATNTVAVGTKSHAFGNSSVAIGANAEVKEGTTNSVALGAGSIADKSNVVSVGAEGAERQITNVAAGTELTDAVNVEQLQDVQTQVGEAIGTGDFSRTNYARGAENVTEAIYGVDAQVKNNTDDLDAYEVAGIVAGTRNNPHTVDGIALGTDSYANGTGATAIGGDAKANQYNSVALGRGAVANAHDSVALGAYSIANDKNVVSVGRDDGSIQRRIVNVADGIKNSDAATIGQMNTAIDTATAGIEAITYADNKTEIGSTLSVDSTENRIAVIGKDGKENFVVNDYGMMALKDETGEKNVFTVDAKGTVIAQDMYIGDQADANKVVTSGQMNTVVFGSETGKSDSLRDGTLLTNKAKSLVEGINKNSEAIESLDENNKVNWDATTNNINEMQSKISTFSAMTSNVDWNAVNSVDWNAVSALSQVAPLSADVTGEFDTTREPINDGSSNTGDEINTGEGNTVNGDSHVTGNAQIDGTLNVKGEATFDGNATFNGKVDMNGELNMNNNKITGVADGAIAEGSTDAVNGGQLFDMQSGLNSRMDNIESRMNDVEDRIDKVGAMAAAIANLRTMGYDPEAPTEIAVGVGQYRSETGLALGIFHYPNQDFMLSASISTSGDEVMGGIGATWKLGRKSAEERAKDEEERILAKAEEIKQAAKRAEVKAQADRHAQLLAEREAAEQPIRPVEEA